MVYQFRQLNSNEEGPIAKNADLLNRPFSHVGNTFEENAKGFVPGSDLETAINTAIAVGSPLLITGEPGTGKTQSAYYTAYKLGIEPVLHFQVKSDSSAGDLLYHFDAVRYFYDANLKARENGGKSAGPIDKIAYIDKRVLWTAFESPVPRLVLIDEIDKAPRDFPNDLLLELDKMKFFVPEADKEISAGRQTRPIVFITSNSERRLPEPFLRRCVYHNIEFSEDLVVKALNGRRTEYKGLGDDFIELATKRFFALRKKALRKVPSTAEYMVWLNVVAAAVNTDPSKLDEYLNNLSVDSFSKHPFLGVLLKDEQDTRDIRSA